MGQVGPGHSHLPIDTAQSHTDGEINRFKWVSKEMLDFSNPTGGVTKTMVLEKIDGRITDGWLMSLLPPFDHLDSDWKRPSGVGGGQKIPQTERN